MMGTAPAGFACRNQTSVSTLFTKRLERGRFIWPTGANVYRELTARSLRVKGRYRYRQLSSVTCSKASIGGRHSKHGDRKLRDECGAHNSTLDYSIGIVQLARDAVIVRP